MLARRQRIGRQLVHLDIRLDLTLGRGVHVVPCAVCKRLHRKPHNESCREHRQRLLRRRERKQIPRETPPQAGVGRLAAGGEDVVDEYEERRRGG